MLVLASASPRRARLLHDAGYRFTVQPTWTDERVAPGTPPAMAAVELAARKALAAAHPHGAWILAADTLLDLDGEILGKPRDEDDARRTLARLSGRDHWIVTGVALRPPQGDLRTDLAQTRVRFHNLTPHQIAAYVATGEPMDKAGAYAIQGGAAAFVEETRGPLDNVIGLPMDIVRTLLADTAYPHPPHL